VHRTILIDYVKDASHQGITAVIRQVAQRDATAQVFRFIRIATGTAERALSGNLDG
jgi:hypothetical protein